MFCQFRITIFLGALSLAVMAILLGGLTNHAAAQGMTNPLTALPTVGDADVVERQVERQVEPHAAQAKRAKPAHGQHRLFERHPKANRTSLGDRSGAGRRPAIADRALMTPPADLAAIARRMHAVTPPTGFLAGRMAAWTS